MSLGFTLQPIKGRLPSIILPMGTSLILEGGGTRGFYSAGVLEAFLEAGIMFPYIAGVSAGAANVLSFVSGQPLRNRQVIEHYVSDPHYVSIRNLLLHRSMFNMDFIFHTVPQRHISFDWDVFRACQVRLLTGAMDCSSGKTVWFEKNDINVGLEAIIASCSVPLISPVVHYHGYDLLDGGMSDPIPIEKSLADGNSFHVIILTRNKGYTKPPFKFKGILKVMYSRYPNVVDAMLMRHEVYHRQLALCEQLEQEGKALIIRPLQPLQVERTGADRTKLLNLHDEGYAEGRKALPRIFAALKKMT